MSDEPRDEPQDEPRVRVIIPFRDRGTDPRRAANLDVVMAWWWAHGANPVIMSDGLEGAAPFNRHRAYNRAVAEFPETDVFVFTEADMILPMPQVIKAVQKAVRAPGLVVPFKEYRYYDDKMTGYIRDLFGGQMDTKSLAEWITLPLNNPASIFDMRAESVMIDGRSIGAVNVVSRTTLDLTGGFTERTSGNWYDDNIIEEGFAFLTRPTRWVLGPAVHLYHLPGWKGNHLTDEDKAATAKNKNLLVNMRADIRLRNKAAVRELLSYRAKVD